MRYLLILVNNVNTLKASMKVLHMHQLRIYIIFFQSFHPFLFSTCTAVFAGSFYIQLYIYIFVGVYTQPTFPW